MKIVFFYIFWRLKKLEYSWKRCFSLFSLFHQILENIKIYSFSNFPLISHMEQSQAELAILT